MKPLTEIVADALPCTRPTDCGVDQGGYFYMCVHCQSRPAVLAAMRALREAIATECEYMYLEEDGCHKVADCAEIIRNFGEPK